MASHLQLQPRVTKRGQKLHLSYELPHRIHTSIICPLTTPNGSTLIIYGHARGLRILWRGGRRRKESSTAYINGTGDLMVDVDDEDGDEFEDGEEEQDPDCPYPSIIQDLHVSFGGAEDKPIAALHLATTPISLSLSSAVPRILKRRAIVAAASSDGKLRVLQIPLSPPADEGKEQVIQDITSTAIELDTDAHYTSSLPADIAIKFLSSEHRRSAALLAPNDDVEGYLLVASAGRALKTWTIPVTADAILSEETDLLGKTLLPSPAVSIALHPSSRSSQLLLADASSAVRIHDPHATAAPRRRPGSSDSTSYNSATGSKLGKWIITFQPSFYVPKELSGASAAYARRKKVLDVKWVLGGRGAFALLEDGEWGIWDISPGLQPKRMDDFAIRGFLGTDSRPETAEPAKQRQGAARLAPSTPNTRKVKEEQLFTGAPKISDAAPRGGISVSSISTKSGAADESVIIWYNCNIYSLPSMQQFWQRSQSGESNSLYSLGFSHVKDIRLMNEEVTSISQFVAKAAGSGIGQMNTQRDLLVTAEHRAIISQSARHSTANRQLFQPTERPTARDQQMLDSGMLDLDGMDRMLDSMAGGIPAPTSRRVGFAS